MSVKNVLMIALVLVNLLLLTAVILHVSAPRAAEAQVVGGGFNFAVVTAKIQVGEDALWVLDLSTRKLYVLRLPHGNNKTMELMDFRDLRRDIRGGGGNN